MSFTPPTTGLYTVTSFPAVMAYSKLLIDATKADPRNRASGSITSSLSANDIGGNIFYYYSLQPSLTSAIAFITATNVTGSSIVQVSLDKTNWMTVATASLSSVSSSIIQFSGKFTDVRVLTDITGSEPSRRPNATASLFLVASSS